MGKFNKRQDLTPEQYKRANKSKVITITNFEDKYLTELQEMDFMMWLSVQWNSTFIRENVFAAVDEKDTLLGVCGLSCDGTWYYLDHGV